MELTPEEQIAEDIAQFYDDPLGFVLYVFPWGEGDLRGRYPDDWQIDFLEQLGSEVKKRGFDGINAVDPVQFSTASGHGIGKSALTAWLILWIMATRPYAKGIVTANTVEQLKTKTWAELGKWLRMCICGHWFDYNSGRGAMSISHKDYKQEWRCDAQTCREENSEAFAGLHAANSTPFYIFDEASAVPDKIFEVREGGTTDGEPMTFDFGNPTRNTGRFYENCIGSFAHRYITRFIDSRTVRITNKKLFEQWIEDYGIDSDFVKVRVLGQFPSAGSLQFIPTEYVDLAQQRQASEFDHNAPLSIGVDVARFGDDETIIFPRIGNNARLPGTEKRRYKGLDGIQVAGKVVETIQEFRNTYGKECSGLFVDATGVGASVVDQLRHLGYHVTAVNFGGKATDSKTYRYKGDEMWGNLRDALRDTLLIPNEGDLKSQLIGREFGFTLSGAMHLETKKDMKKRGLSSPDWADALALTFAQTLAPIRTVPGAHRNTNWDYDPLEGN